MVTSLQNNKVKSTLVIIILLALIATYFLNKDIPLEALHISFISPSDISTYDPSNIQYNTHALMIRQLYLTLFLFNENGKIENLAAQSFTFEKNLLTIQINENIHSTKNDHVTAKDFELSFKRLIFLSKNTHGDLKLFIDIKEDISVNDKWDNIWSEHNTLYMKLKENIAIDLFLPILASNDFSVIPRNSIDWNSENLKIKDYTNTPGAYHYHSTLNDKTIVLAKNNNSIIDTKISPKLIYLHPHWGDATYKKMITQEIDIKPTIDPMRFEQMQGLINSKYYQFKKTINIKELSFNYIGAARKIYSEELKFKIGKVLRKALIENGQSLFSQYTPSNQFISPISEGSLSKEQLKIISDKWDSVDISNFEPGLEVKILAYGIPDEDFKKIFGEFKWLKRTRYDSRIGEQNIEMGHPDIYITASDSNFYESVSFVSYNFSIEKLSTTKDPQSQWLSTYTTEKNKIKRLNLLQKLHFENLNNGNIIPVGHSYYSILHKKNIHVPMYKEFAEMMFWKIIQK